LGQSGEMAEEEAMQVPCEDGTRIVYLGLAFVNWGRR
jgi:hypothetical protein